MQLFTKYWAGPHLFLKFVLETDYLRSGLKSHGRDSVLCLVSQLHLTSQIAFEPSQNAQCLVLGPNELRLLMSRCKKSQ